MYHDAEDATRWLVAIVGPPAAGKSTISDQFCESLNRLSGREAAVVVPMDGFHLDNALLEAAGTIDRKGAPWTFDVDGFASLLQRIRQPISDQPVLAPLFDRAADLSRASARAIQPWHRFVIVEGNYLLLDESPWSGLHGLFDTSVSLDVALEVLEQRLVQRWLDHGLDGDAARRRAEHNDLPNARRVLSHSRTADFVLRCG
ncbi:nucleoside triphosphate hydrolase [Gammaproteobacteria bacterium]|nr:nucleoside triphosphate hydrolase [Gammaproteobacteria bacterium]